MFDIGAAELLVIIVVAVIVIGPKDMPLAMRTAGRWIGKVRKVSAHFRTGIDAMVREAELEDMEKKWKARNAEIMERSGPTDEDYSDEPAMTGPPPVAENRVANGVGQPLDRGSHRGSGREGALAAGNTPAPRGGQASAPRSENNTVHNGDRSQDTA